MLGSKDQELMYQNSNLYCWQTIIKIGLVLFRLAQSICVLCKVGIKLMHNLLCNSVWLDRLKIRLNQSKLGHIVFLQNSSNLAQAHLTCRVLCFVLSIKGKTLATFQRCSICCVCESFVRSRGGCLHTYLGFPRFKIMSRTW